MPYQFTLMQNMAKSIGQITNTRIESMTFELTDNDLYVCNVFYSNGQEVTIRQDCTIVDDIPDLE